VTDKPYVSTLESSGRNMDLVDIARFKTEGEE
jgi:hypothetical protein